MMFDENSVVAKVWYEAVNKGDKQLEEVPNLSNLVTVVTNMVEVDTNV